MTKFRKIDLLGKLVQAAVMSGWTVSYHERPPTHPFRLHLHRGDEGIGILVYIWNITHGGRKRPEDEYRVQVTGVESIERSPAYKTLLLGYWKEGDVYAGWDASLHAGPVAFSPSLQIRQDSLLAARTSGFAVCPKDQGELAIAFAPSFFVNYCRHLEGLHAAGALAAEVAALNAVGDADGNVPEAALLPLPAERRKIVSQVARWQRASSFRQRVLTAYGHRCAACGLQMELVDAAHLVPVEHQESSDDTANGICLCALHHRAFDGAVIGFRPDYRIVVNDAEIARLDAADRGAGKAEFVGRLRPTMDLPPERAQRPRPETLRLALQVRGWPA